MSLTDAGDKIPSGGRKSDVADRCWGQNTIWRKEKYSGDAQKKVFCVVIQCEKMAGGCPGKENLDSCSMLFC